MNFSIISNVICINKISLKRQFSIFFTVFTTMWAFLDPLWIFIDGSRLLSSLGVWGYIFLIISSLLIVIVVELCNHYSVPIWAITGIIFCFVLLSIGSAWLYSASRYSILANTIIHQERDGIVVIEAEHFSLLVPGSGNKAYLATWHVVEEKDFSGEEALQAFPLTDVNTANRINGPALIYRIEFTKASTYTVDLRGTAPYGKQHDSVHIGVSGTPVTAVDSSGTGVGFSDDKLSWMHTFCVETSKNDKNCVNNQPTQIYIAEPGIYNLNVWMREDGVIIDKIIVSSNVIENENVKNTLQETIK